MKRAVDAIIAAVGLVLALPVMAVVAVLVRVKLGTPVLFRQERPGLHGQPFEMIKFRTMLDITDEYGQALPDEVRLTPFGEFIRSTSLDELPELWNVLRGDMSLVGPRPLLMDYLPRYTARQARRHEVRPGLTGWAQVNGRNAADWEERLERDVWYVENRSQRLDIKIIAMTLRTVLHRKGISAQGQATVQRFGE